MKKSLMSESVLARITTAETQQGIVPPQKNHQPTMPYVKQAV
jgi:hypothetical protein